MPPRRKKAASTRIAFREEPVAAPMKANRNGPHIAENFEKTE